MSSPPIDLTRMPPMSPDEYAALMLITGDQYLFRYREKGGGTHYKFVPPAAVRAAFIHETLDTQWLPANVRRWGVGKQGEWLLIAHPPHAYTFAFAAKEGKEPLVLKVPMPGLAVMGYGQRYFIWAFADRELTGDSSLYHAPLPNVDGNGAICFGSNLMPQASARTIEEAWRIFLTSPFSSHSVNGKSRAFPEDVRVQLENFAQEKRRRYPPRDLVPLGRTVNQAVENVVKGIL